MGGQVDRTPCSSGCHSIPISPQSDSRKGHWSPGRVVNFSLFFVLFNVSFLLRRTSCLRPLWTLPDWRRTRGVFSLSAASVCSLVARQQYFTVILPRLRAGKGRPGAARYSTLWQIALYGKCYCALFMIFQRSFPAVMGAELASAVPPPWRFPTASRGAGVSCSCWGGY